MQYFLSDEDRYVLLVGPDICNTNNTILFVDGYIGHNFERFYHKTTFDLKPSDKLNNFENEVYDPYGEWVSVTKNNKKITAKIDFFGFYRLFYSSVFFQGQESLVISNCFNSISDFLIDKYVRSELDAKAFYPIVASFDNYFANNFSCHTASSDIKTLRPDQIISYDYESGKIELIDRLKDYNNYSFDELMILGKDYLESSINELSSYDINLFLSGGNDSRACLSILLANIESSKIKVSTAIPHTNESLPNFNVLVDDFRVANLIRKKYQLKWYEDSSRCTKHFAPQQYFEYISKYRSNSYFSNLANKARLACSIDSYDLEVQIRGGAGELLRTSAYYSGALKKASRNGVIHNRSETVEEDLSLLFDTICVADKTSDLHQKSKIFFVQYVKNNIGNNIEEKLNYRYYLERNNRHFGHHREKLALGKRTFFPLANPYWFIAAQMLTLEDRENKDFLILIHELYTPELLNFPFEGSEECNEIEYQDDLSEYKELLSVNKVSNLFSIDKKNTDIDSYNFIKSQSLQMIAMISDHSEIGANIFNDKVKKYLSGKLELGGSISFSAYMKIKSIYDVIYPTVPAYTIYK